ncbi:cupin domain-containing protein [Streptomyces sp. ISL-36]|nr:cupin domain-containing protein [Streptomyces sp. ISL-36]MBT2440135.1 cupin domain-containing protein [Streptomyces sp. ISL-36]
MDATIVRTPMSIPWGPQGAGTGSEQITYVAPGEGPSVWALQGDKYTMKAGKSTTGPGFTMLEGEIAPDNGPPMHIHNDADEIFYLLDGELTVASGDEVIKAESGAFIFIPRGAKHKFRNDSSKITKLLFVLAPAGFENFFFEIGQPVVPGLERPAEPVGYEQLVMQRAEEFGMFIVDE